MALKKFTESPEWQLFTSAQRSQIEKAGSIAEQTRLFNQFKATLGVGLGAGAGVNIATTTPATTTTSTPSATATKQDSPTGQYVLVFKGGQTQTITAASYSEASKVASSTGIGVVDVFAVPEGYYPSAIEEFLDYWAFTRTPEGQMYPQPQSVEDYFDNVRDRALEFRNTGVLPAAPEGAAAAEFTDDQIRAFNDYKQWYYQYGQPGDWFPVDVADFYANYDTAQAQLNTWQQQGAAVEQYALSPEEAARRREESYAESRYAAAERYGETPMYQEKFTQWLKGQTDMSGALTQYVESQYPSLRSEFEAGLPRLTGYPTREEARAEAARRETGFQAWLTQAQPEVYQEYMGQRPSARGERYYEYSPTTRYAGY